MQPESPGGGEEGGMGWERTEPLLLTFNSAVNINLPLMLRIV